MEPDGGEPCYGFSFRVEPQTQSISARSAISIVRSGRIRARISLLLEMVRHVNIVVNQPESGVVLDILYSSKKVFKIVRFNTVDSVHISFKAQDKHLEEVLFELMNRGVGETFGTIDVFSLIATRPIINFKGDGNLKDKKKSYSISDRMTVAEIEEVVEDGNHMTFDYMALLTVASTIAGAGLLSDSPTAVIASMLVSPLMGPILSITFGLSTLKWGIVKRGFRNELLGVVITFIVGLIIGGCAFPYYGAHFRSMEMMSRGKPSNLIIGLVVAAPSGMGVILALSKGGFSAIVGTAISASLLPPLVNCGMCLMISYLNWHHHRDRHDTMIYRNTGLISFMLWLVNFVAIVIVGFLTFRYIKKVHPPVYRVPLHGNTDINYLTEPLTSATTLSPLSEHGTERLSRGSRTSDLSDTLLRCGSNEDVLKEVNRTQTTPMQSLYSLHDDV